MKPEVEAKVITKPAYDLAALRDKFEVAREGIAYLNHAGMSPLPAPVKQAMIQVVEAMARSGGQAFADLEDSLFKHLPACAGELVNARPEEIALVENTSTGINMIAQSLPLQPGDNVALCDVEFPSNVYPWQNLAHRGIECRLVPAHNGGLSLEQLDAMRDSRTRVVAVSAVQFFTGRLENIAAIGQYCADHNIWLVVDAIQAAGITPLDMKAMGIHALVTGGQKALMAPPGQGFMAIRLELIEQMTPIFVGPLSVVGWEHWLKYELTPNTGARRFNLGTPNLVGMTGLLAALELLLEIGVENISAWVTHLSGVAIDDLTQRGYQVITPLDPKQHANIVTFAIDGDPTAITETLKEKGIFLRAHLDTAGNVHLRISTHCYNTEEEVTRVGKALEEVNNEQH